MISTEPREKIGGDSGELNFARRGVAGIGRWFSISDLFVNWAESGVG
jgi:hypothetical protein